MSNTDEGATYSSNNTGGNLRRKSAGFLVALLLFSLAPMTLPSVAGESTNHNLFTGGFATVEINLQGNVTNTSASIDLPRNSTVTTSSVEISVDSEDDSPGAVWVDVGQDGTNEWEFTGLGYGNLGHQNQFYDGSEYFTTDVYPGNTPTPGFLFPTAGSMESTALNVSFSPLVGGGFFSIGEHQEVIETDIDGDGYPEPMFLSTITSNNTTSIVWADWNLTSGTSINSGIQTCDNASSISVGDVNGDGNQDIVAFSTISGNACIHIANGSTFDPLNNQSVSSDLKSATLGDINGDGLDEVIAITTLGSLTFQSWSNSTSSLSMQVSQVINQNGSFGMPADLVSVHAQDFFGNGNISVLVKDSLGHWSMWGHFSGNWGGPLAVFDDIQTDEILTDLDGDGDIDILGSSDQGNMLRINDGTNWNLVTVQNQAELTNSTIADFDNDGDLDLMTPQAGISDGNSTTIEGSIALRSINASNISSPATLILQPWSLPTSLITMDMDGDGVLEHIVSAGELSYGVFIGGWHTIGLDANRDGISEISNTGYAGNSSNGLFPLMIVDEASILKQNLSLIISNQVADVDSYGISMSNLSMNLSSTGTGQVNYSGLDIGYDCSFTIDQNPSISFNLTNSLNQLMTGGVGDLTIQIPINSTKAGKVSLSNLFVTTIPGAPNLAIPTTPVVYISSINSTQVELSWNPLTDYGEDFLAFEIFRLNSSSESIDLSSPYDYSNTNNTIDSFVTTGSTYYYSIRSIHTYGITSNLSSLLEVTIPFPQPPSPISGLKLMDVNPDSGGSLELSWDHSSDPFAHYEVYLENSYFDNISGLTSLLNVSSNQNSTIIENLIDGQEYWAAVVAVNEFGNKSEDVVSVGPTYPRNDDPNSVNLQLSVSSETSLGSPFNLEITAEVDGQQITPPGDITITMQSNSGTYPISTNWDNISLTDFSQLLSFAPEIGGEVTFWANYSGDDGDEQTRPLAPASTSASTIVTVSANFSSSEEVYELDWENETTVTIDLDAVNPLQQDLLNGTTFTWVAYNETTGNSSTGDGIIQNGNEQFIVSFNESGMLYINITGPTWIDADSNSLELSLAPYGSTIEDNNSGENQTTETPWSPDVMLDVTFDCGTVVVDPSIDQELDCTITNPNNYSVDISLEADGWSQWSEFILFEPSAGQGDFTLAGFESRNLEIRIDILQDLRENALTLGLIQVDLRQGPTDYTSPADVPQTFEIQWSLIEEDVVVEPNPQENNTNKTTNTKDTSSSDNTMLILGGIAGLAVIGLVVVIILRMRNSDFEDWDEDDLDMEPEVEAPQRASKPLPVGVALDEFEDKTIIDETPDRPDIINEFDDSVDYDETSDDYGEEYTEEEETEDSGISVDEHGTEWYEDEVGVWWYREEGQEDWSEFVDE